MDKKNLKVMFMGTPEISAYVFEAMIQDGYQFVGLVAQPDKPVGRHNILCDVPTKIIAKKYNIPVFQPIKIRKEFEFVKDLNPDVIVTLAYGQIVPQGLLDIPRFGCVNLHGSLLPKYRGASPIQASLINGDKETGVTLMEMIDKMDAGKMFAKKSVYIDDNDNCTTLFDKIKFAAKDLILESLPDYIDGKLPGIAQDETLVTFCSTIKKEEEHLNLSLPVVNVLGWIKALADQPGAYLTIDNIKVKIFKAHIVSDKVINPPGTINNSDKNGLILQCSDGELAIDELQKEGKKRIDYKSFINGWSDLKGKMMI